MRLDPAGAAAPGPIALGEEPGERRLRRIAQFHPDHRRTIREFTLGASVLEDLADSFPGLLFALATGFGQSRSRAHAFEALTSGAPLRTVSNALGLAWWLRRLPAGAFADPLAELPGDADACLRFGSLVPAETAQCTPWLKAVIEAELSGGRAYALWMARHGATLNAAFSEHRRMLLNAWVWASAHPEAVAHRLVRRPWSDDLGIKRVLEELTAWTQRLALAEWLGSGQLRPWIEDGVAHGYRFTTLRTAADFIATAEALDNCLEQYADRLGSGTCMVARISRAGKVVACVEVAPHEVEKSMPAIVQLRGPRNRRVALEVWQAAYAWIGARPVDAFSFDRLLPPAADQAEMRFELWQPYLSALASQPGGATVEVRCRHHLAARHGAMGERSRRPMRPPPLRAAPLVPAERGFPEVVLRRIAEMFPRGR